MSLHPWLNRYTNSSVTGGIPYKDRLNGLGHEFACQVMFHVATGAILHPTIPDGISPDCKQFLKLCFTRDFHARPDVGQLLEESFLRSARTLQPSVGDCPCGCALVARDF